MSAHHVGRPASSEYASYFETYVSKVPEDKILPALAAQVDLLAAALDGVTEENAGYRYAEGKWSIRQLLAHLVDTERIMAYRALCVARGEQASLPSFDENLYAQSSEADGRSLAGLLDELRLVRDGNVKLFSHLSEGAWTRLGTANGLPITPRGLAWILVGHIRHHLGVFEERYRPGLPA